MGIKAEKKITKEEERISIDAEVLGDARAYGVFLSDSSLNHVITESLRTTMMADKEFQKWLPNNPKAREKKVAERKQAQAGPVLAAAAGR